MDTSAALLLRSVIEDEVNDATISCETGNDFNGALALRISSIFVILLGSLAGILFPLLARPPTPQTPSSTPKPRSALKITIPIPQPLLFATKHFSSGILLATAFIHLLAPASEALRNPCLTGLVTEYPWVEAIVLITVVVTFFVEILVGVFAGDAAGGGYQVLRGDDVEGKGGYRGLPGDEGGRAGEGDGLLRAASDSDSLSLSETETLEEDHSSSNSNSNPNSGLLSTSPSHPSIRATNPPATPTKSQSHSQNTQPWKPHLTRLLLLESSIILHSLLIGLSLSVAGPEFPTLYAVLVFHQTFEGLGLGTRLAEIRWPPSKQYTPYILGCAYALSTPMAIAVGLCVRGSYSPGSQGVLVVSGVFDSVSAGVLIYSGLVEVMAREFLFQPEFHSRGKGHGGDGGDGDGRGRDVRSVFAAFFWLCAGAAAMAVLGKWA
ncbi:Zinc/iron permease [Aspergillus carlsbadensis]|nr:Zinc/iron permease [Aspergillus carlsbadensis]